MHPNFKTRSQRYSNGLTFVFVIQLYLTKIVKTLYDQTGSRIPKIAAAEVAELGRHIISACKHDSKTISKAMQMDGQVNETDINPIPPNRSY